MSKNSRGPVDALLRWILLTFVNQIIRQLTKNMYPFFLNKPIKGFYPWPPDNCISSLLKTDGFVIKLEINLQVINWYTLQCNIFDSLKQILFEYPTKIDP